MTPDEEILTPEKLAHALTTRFVPQIMGAANALLSPAARQSFGDALEPLILRLINKEWEPIPGYDPEMMP